VLPEFSSVLGKGQGFDFYGNLVIFTDEISSVVYLEDIKFNLLDQMSNLSIHKGENSRDGEKQTAKSSSLL
jgi:hypothetical protein